MADRLMRAQVTLPLDSGVPEDSIINTFHFDQDDNGILPPPQDSYDAVVQSLKDFYDLAGPAVLGSNLTGQANVKIYDMRDPMPRVLRDEQSFTFAPRAAASLPNEVAICVSFAATPIAGVRRARTRGRVFLGPIANDVGVVTNSQLRVPSGVRTSLAAAGTSLLTPNDVSGSSLSFAIYSPTMDKTGSSIDDAFNDAQTGWVDDAFDTQRRRGPAASVRTTFS